MPEFDMVRFSFVADELPEDTFTVLSFTGHEELSRPFEYVIDMYSDDPDIDVDALIGKPGTFEINHLGRTRRVNGTIARFCLGNEIMDDCYFYKAVLVPRIWLKSLSRHNQIFQDMSVIDVLRIELTGTRGKGIKDHSALNLVEGQDFQFRLAGSYPTREYIVQWNETELDFFHRLLEREGLYYYFEQDDDRERIVICDRKVFLPAFQDTDTFRFAAWRATRTTREPVIQRLMSSHSLAPKQTVSTDYNYETPHLLLQGTAHIDDQGIGVVSEYGQQLFTMNEAKNYATLHAESWQAGRVVFEGDSDCHVLTPGYEFGLEGHFRSAYNKRFRVISLRHEGTIESKGQSDIRSDTGRHGRYSNSFECVYDDVEIRLPRRTPWPRVEGLINATIDAEGGGGMPEIDEQGRYKVRFFFDLSGAADGKASMYLRLATPFGGPNEGLHFPLRKGTEVLVAFINGDPDRPVIAAVAPNPKTVSPVTSINPTTYVTRTPGGVTTAMGNRLSPGGAGGEGQMGGDHLRRAPAEVRRPEPVATARQNEAAPALAEADADTLKDMPPAQQFGDDSDVKSNVGANYTGTLVCDDSGKPITYTRYGESPEGYEPFMTVEDNRTYTMDEDPAESALFSLVYGGRFNVTHGSIEDAQCDDSLGQTIKWTKSWNSGLGAWREFTYQYAKDTCVTVGDKEEAFIGNSAEFKFGTSLDVAVTASADVKLLTCFEYNLGYKFAFGKLNTFEGTTGTSVEVHGQKDMIAGDEIVIGVSPVADGTGEMDALAMVGVGAAVGSALAGYTAITAVTTFNEDKVSGGLELIDTATMSATIAANIAGYASYARNLAVAEAMKANLGGLQPLIKMTQTSLTISCGGYTLSMSAAGVNISFEEVTLFEVNGVSGTTTINALPSVYTFSRTGATFEAEASMLSVSTSGITANGPEVSFTSMGTGLFEAAGGVTVQPLANLGG